MEGFVQSRVLRGALMGMCAVVNPAMAKESIELFATPRLRSMGMAMTAVVDDENALYSNPAGLAQLQTWKLRLPDMVSVSISPSVLDLYKEVGNLGGGSSASDIASSLSEFDGKSACGGLELLGFGYYSNRFTIAVNPFTSSGCFRIRTPSALFAKIQARLTVDAGLTVAYSKAFHSDQVRIGMALKPFLARGGMDRTLENTEILNLKDSGLSEIVGVGWGFDFDLGVQGNLKPMPMGPVQVKPMAGIALQNSLATQYSNPILSSYRGTVPALERKLNIGVGASVESFGAFRPLATLELRDIVTRTDSFWEHVAGGIELTLQPKKFFRTALRGHFYKGNFGGGFGLKLSVLELEFGTYAVNLGKGPGVGVDRRMYAQTSLVW